jgi:hypothetical protein
MALATKGLKSVSVSVSVSEQPRFRHYLITIRNRLRLSYQSQSSITEGHPLSHLIVLMVFVRTESRLVASYRSKFKCH